MWSNRVQAGFCWAQEVLSYRPLGVPVWGSPTREALEPGASPLFWGVLAHVVSQAGAGSGWVRGVGS